MTPMDDLELDAFQALLLELLDGGAPPEELKARLSAAPAAAPFADWIAGWEPRCIETASVLVRRWGHRRTDAPAKTRRQESG
jgi:hypothetical protein